MIFFIWGGMIRPPHKPDRVNETNFDSVFQASKTQHEGELIIWVHSLKKENKDLMAKFDSCQTNLSHTRKLYFSISPEFTKREYDN